jgi:glutathione S-transferase
MPRALDVATSYAASTLRLGSGMAVGRLGPRPARLLELYDFEACPYCRKVREALSILDLDAMILPCPRGGERYRPEVRRRGREQFPYLVDPDANVALWESADIVRHLFARYGDGPVPLLLVAPVVADVTSMLASAARLGAGGGRRPARRPALPLQLWSFEASPYCRLVREALCTLELPYVLHNVAKGSPRREAFVARAGKMQVPYLADPNTGEALFESADIVAYLDRTYTLS